MEWISTGSGLGGPGVDFFHRINGPFAFLISAEGSLPFKCRLANLDITHMSLSRQTAEVVHAATIFVGIGAFPMRHLHCKDSA